MKFLRVSLNDLVKAFPAKVILKLEIQIFLFHEEFFFDSPASLTKTAKLSSRQDGGKLLIVKCKSTIRVPSLIMFVVGRPMSGEALWAESEGAPPGLLFGSVFHYDE